MFAAFFQVSVLSGLRPQTGCFCAYLALPVIGYRCEPECEPRTMLDECREFSVSPLFMDSHISAITHACVLAAYFHHRVRCVMRVVMGC
jgi:hypothetical protein